MSRTERVTGPKSVEAVQIRQFMVAIFLDTGDFARAVSEARTVCRADEERHGSKSEATLHGRLTKTSLRSIRIDHNSESDGPPDPPKAA
ncbi:hypothetical protein [Streptomyces rishiriensis]|uniref:hypothetical protein n=1 Tax=Streptomyces rishiriensis TaxID=68264 RepID=UPI0037CD5482